jgi:hypothetical protein
MGKRTEYLAQELQLLSISRATFMSPERLTTPACIPITAQLSTIRPVNSNGWHATTAHPPMHLITPLALPSMAQAMFM